MTMDNEYLPQILELLTENNRLLKEVSDSIKPIEVSAKIKNMDTLRTIKSCLDLPVNYAESLGINYTIK